MSRIVVKNLPSQGIYEADIRKHFADVDTITEVKLKFNEQGTFRRFCFVGFKSESAGEKAVELLNNTFIKNNKVSLELCKAVKEIKRNSSNHDTKDPQDAANDSGKKKSKPRNVVDEAFDEVKDERQFKEFLSLQRNIGETANSKQIWADDARMDVGDDTENANTTPSQTKDVDGQKEAGPHKRHKRSRGNKKSSKTKPKELFVHTIKIKGFPPDIRRKDIKDFFKPLEVLSIRINKRDGVSYVSLKDESDLKFALRKNLQFWNTSRIKIARHNVKKSRIFKETVDQKVKEKQESAKKYEESLANVEPVSESGRIFVRNLNYTCRQEDLEEVFSKYGELTEVDLPIDKNSQIPKGYAYVEFLFPENAARAFEELNGTIFQGRNFHLIPSKPKPQSNQSFLVTQNANSSFKRDKLLQQKQNEATRPSPSWNTLFLGQNALANVVSDMKGVEKSKLLTQQTNKEPISVRMALGDAMVVEEMRKFLVSNGIELDSFDNPKAPRSRTVIIVKNLPASTDKRELNELFEAHGQVSRVIMPPNGMTALIEMEDSMGAKAAFKKLAYHKFNDSVLYLEWAPINVFREKSLEEQERNDLEQLKGLQTGAKILVKNVPFEATVAEVRKIFAAYGELSFVRLPKKIDGQHRGFAFVDYLTKEDALRAFRSLCHSTHLYGRKLVLEWAKNDANSAASSSGQKEAAEFV